MRIGILSLIAALATGVGSVFAQSPPASEGDAWPGLEVPGSPPAGPNGYPVSAGDKAGRGEDDGFPMPGQALLDHHASVTAAEQAGMDDAAPHKDDAAPKWPTDLDYRLWYRLWASPEALLWWVKPGPLSAPLATTGTPTGGYRLNPSTVTHAAAGDSVALGSANDWLFWRMAGSSDVDTVTGAPEFSTFI